MEFAVWTAIIVAVTLLGRWAFSVDTHAQEGGGPTPTVTQTTLGEEGDGDEEEKRENAPDCEEPFNAGHPSCSGYVSIVDQTATAEARQTATAEARRTATAEARKTQTAVAETATAVKNLENRRATQTAVSANKTATKVAFHTMQTAVAEKRPTITPLPIPTLEGIFVPTEVPCPPGFSRSWCKEHTPTPTDDDDDDPTPRPTPCRTGGSSAKDSESTSRCPTPTHTHTPTPTPTLTASVPVPTMPRLVAEVTLGGNSVHNGAALNWRVFEEQSVIVTIRMADGGPAKSESISDYEFRLYTNPSETGLHVYRGSPDCDAGGLGDLTVWVSSPVFQVNMTRCGLGNVSNSGLQVRAKRSRDGTPFTVTDTRNFMQAKHIEGGSIGYRINLEPIYGTRPETLADDYFSKRALVVSAAAAAAALNGAVGQILSAGSDVSVAPYWEGASKCTTAEDPNPNGLACHLGYASSRSLPHYTRGEIWAKYPPDGYAQNNEPTNWTDDPGVILLDHARVYRFLPDALAHEFGHAFGLAHLNVKGAARLMWEGTHSRVRTIGIGEVDKDGLREVTKQHGD